MAIPTSSAGSARTIYKPIKTGRYYARLVRFVGLGMQPQRPYQGQAKRDSFKVSLQWELFQYDEDKDAILPVDAVEIKDGEEVITERPSCVFQDITVNPGVERGKAFDLCEVFDPEVKKVPNDMEYFFGLLGQAAMIEVTQYESPKGSGTYRNGVGGFSPVSKRDLKDMPVMRSEKVGFDPYSDSQENKVAYARLFPFQRTILTEAKDGMQRELKAGAQNYSDVRRITPLTDIIPLVGSEPIQLDGVTDKEQKPAFEAKQDVPFDVDMEQNPFM